MEPSRRQSRPFSLTASTIFLCPRFPPLSVTCAKPHPSHTTPHRKFKTESTRAATAARPFPNLFLNTKGVFVPTMNKAESSRTNGAKSHGPVTPEGKQHSKLNALRHGILATFICLTSEEKDKFKELVQDFLTRM